MQKGHKTAMDYLSMIQSIPSHRTALVEDGHTYTYGEIAREACQIRSCKIPSSKKPSSEIPSSEIPSSKIPSLAPASGMPCVVWIREKSVHRQLVEFLALSGTCHVPVIVPGDMKHLPPIPPEKDIPAGACMGILTSGTTGFPKLWYRTRESWSGFFPVQNSIFGITNDTRLFTHGSLAFTGNLNLYLSLLSVGAAIITATPVNPAVWANEIKAQSANAIYLIPSKLRLLPKKVPVPIPRIKTILSGSQSLGLKDIESIQKAFPHSRCYLYYGASELSYVTWLTDLEMNSNPACIGRPFPGISVTLSDNEIYVDTPYSAIGIKGPYSVGDTGYIDKNGYLYFNGRKDNVYNIHGRKISAVKIENALTSLDGIQEAAVLLQEGTLKAYIVPADSDHTADLSTSSATVSPAYPLSSQTSLCKTIKKELETCLESWEIPRDFIIQKELPKNNSGKTAKKLLSASAAP